jgi:hypothetical protein
LHHFPQVLRDCLPFADLLEMLHQHLNGQAALYFELAVNTRLGISPALLGNVGGDNFYFPIDELLIMLEGSWPRNRVPGRLRRRCTRSEGGVFARAVSMAGKIVSRNRSNGTLSRKKNTC